MAQSTSGFVVVKHLFVVANDKSCSSSLSMGSQFQRPPAPGTPLAPPPVKGDRGEREKEALIEFDNEDDPTKLLCSTCSKSLPQHSINTRKPPSVSLEHCVGIDPPLTGSFNT